MFICQSRCISHNSGPYSVNGQTYSMSSAISYDTKARYDFPDDISNSDGLDKKFRARKLSSPVELKHYSGTENSASDVPALIKTVIAKYGHRSMPCKAATHRSLFEVPLTSEPADLQRCVDDLTRQNSLLRKENDNLTRRLASLDSINEYVSKLQQRKKFYKQRVAEFRDLYEAKTREVEALRTSMVQAKSGSSELNSASITEQTEFVGPKANSLKDSNEFTELREKLKAQEELTRGYETQINKILGKMQAVEMIMAEKNQGGNLIAPQLSSRCSNPECNSAYPENKDSCGTPARVQTVNNLDLKDASGNKLDHRTGSETGSERICVIPFDSTKVESTVPVLPLIDQASEFKNALSELTNECKSLREVLESTSAQVSRYAKNADANDHMSEEPPRPSTSLLSDLDLIANKMDSLADMPKLLKNLTHLIKDSNMRSINRPKTQDSYREVLSDHRTRSTSKCFSLEGTDRAHNESGPGNKSHEALQTSFLESENPISDFDTPHSSFASNASSQTQLNDSGEISKLWPNPKPSKSLIRGEALLNKLIYLVKLLLSESAFDNEALNEDDEPLTDKVLVKSDDAGSPEKFLSAAPSSKLERSQSYVQKDCLNQIVSDVVSNLIDDKNCVNDSAIKSETTNLVEKALPRSFLAMRVSELDAENPVVF